VVGSASQQKKNDDGVARRNGALTDKRVNSISIDNDGRASEIGCLIAHFTTAEHQR